MVGSILGHYRVDALVGQGGMGAVYRAFDIRLRRAVAIKVLTEAVGAKEAAARVLHEARAASSLSHPHIVTIHSVEHDAGVDFIVMEFVDGSSLAQLIPPAGLPIDRAIDYATQIADAVAMAHRAGIVHRDIKPANVIAADSGALKVLDFGIARRTALPDDVTRQLTVDGTLTVPGEVAGTIGYLAPEQIAGRAADARSDVFSLGVLIYEMLTGARPFAGDSAWAIIDATMRAEPPSLRARRSDIPAALHRIVAKCLAKRPEERYASAREVADDLRALTTRTAGGFGRRPLVVAGVAAAVVIAAVSAGTMIWMRARDERAARARAAVPQVSRLVDAGEVVQAFRVARAALASAPNDPEIIAAYNEHTEAVRLESTPPGADMSIREYAANDAGWIPLGRTPSNARVPLGQVRWRVAKNGYDTIEVSPNNPQFTFALAPTGTVPEGMVFVAHGTFQLESTGKDVGLPDYYIDKFEVTNRQFKQFVDAGGYATRRYWTQPFVKDGRTLDWNEAISLFRDSTGRPGPSTWELGTYPDGQDDFPVNGVSWYEAAAYGEWAHKRLPTAYHWYHASGAFGIFSNILNFSNFAGKGTVKVGSAGGLGPYGTYDMAGNVKEWCWNATTSRGWRYILGGAYNEATYKFRDEDAQPPFERGPGFGFRLMQQRTAMEDAQLAPIETLERDAAALKPVGDAIYAVYRRLYDYDPTPIDGRVDEVDESNRYWRRELVSFRAAYGNDRVPAWLFIPRSVPPPYQTLVFFPASDALTKRPSREAALQWMEYLVRGGRAVIYPVYQDTYERYVTRPKGPGQNFLREISIQRALDLRRAIDYLQSRPDVDRSRIGFYAMSLGAQLAPVFLALEPERLKTAALISGGFETWTLPPESDPVNFAPRVHQPVLMVNGREDFDLPYETAQVPMFNALGTPPADKRHVIFEGGHIPPHPLEIYKVVLDWYDKYLGPVSRQRAGSESRTGS
jgi:formylglycine-generating enzyme required for sulfatase activity